MWTFYLHYNKPASLKAKRPLMSVHFRDRCYIVDVVECMRPTRSAIRNRQPRVVMKGMATNVSTFATCDGDVAVIE
jgi:hypothetical protein